MKNILIVSPTGGYAGIDVCIQTLVYGLDKTKFTPIVVFPVNSMLKKQFEEQEIKCYELPLNWWFPISFSSNDIWHVIPTLREKVIPLIHIIKDNNVDIVLSNTSVGFDGAIASAICNVTHIFFLHAKYEDNIYKDMLKETKEFIYQFMGRVSYKLVCCSKLLQSYLEQYVDNSIFIYNGVDTSKFKFMQRILNQNDDLNMVCIGHYNANKQQDFVIEALNCLKKKRPGLLNKVSFTMIGPGESVFLEKLKGMVSEYKLGRNVHFEDFRSDINTYIQNFNLYINSSISENLPVSVIEAMASGMPTLGVPNDGTIQLISEGKTGFITETPEKMADRIIYILENPEIVERMSKLSRERAENYFSATQYVRNFEKLFDEIDEKSKKGEEFAKFVNNIFETFTGRSLSKYQKKKILVIYPDAAKATYYIAAENPLKYLREMDLIDFESITPEYISDQKLKSADIIYCIRFFDDFIYSILNKAKCFGIPFIWFIDDNYSAITFQDNKVIHQESDNYMYERMYRDSSAVIVQSGELYHYGRKFTREIYRLSTYQILNNSLNIKKSDHKNIIRIGFMGTLLRDGDFEFVTPAIERIIREYGNNVEFEFIGYYPEVLKNYPQVKIFNFISDYNEFREFLYSRNWDIALAPLNNTQFNRSKTNNKYREYSSFCITGIFSNIPTYNSCVKNEENGLIVENTIENWYSGIKELVDNKGIREKLAKNAFEDIRKNYNLEKFAKELIEVFNYYTRCDDGSIEEKDGCINAVNNDRKNYIPEELCFSSVIKRSRKYNTYCDCRDISKIGLLFKKVGIAEGDVTIKIWKGNILLREIKKSISEIDFLGWTYFSFPTVYRVGGKVLTIEVGFEYKCGGVGIYETRRNRNFIYKVFNKIGRPLKGMNVIFLDFRQ
ncbi:glycosyltransferase family 4 protein [Ruminiclostridium cellobioparum]|uniref:glycosyltransferase family 4 protein n=1 Tax=Ruminiclostridium cellobioparum TaxID=29355 RepID=UPI0028AE0E12|nr:glycosyltransferase [Ruminiclostridium cellobioparum]